MRTQEGMIEPPDIHNPAARIEGIAHHTQVLTSRELLGGTSWVTTFATRGSPADYDERAALGNGGGGFDDELPYLKRLKADADFGYHRWHGDQGAVARLDDVSIVGADRCTGPTA